MHVKLSATFSGIRPAIFPIPTHADHKILPEGPSIDIVHTYLDPKAKIYRNAFKPRQQHTCIHEPSLCSSKIGSAHPVCIPSTQTQGYVEIVFLISSRCLVYRLKGKYQEGPIYCHYGNRAQQLYVVCVSGPNSTMAL